MSGSSRVSAVRTDRLFSPKGRAPYRSSSVGTIRLSESIVSARIQTGVAIFEPDRIAQAALTRSNAQTGSRSSGISLGGLFTRQTTIKQYPATHGIALPQRRTWF